MSELRAFECGVKGKDWKTVVHAMSSGKAKSEYQRDLHESWPEIPYTAITCRCLGRPVTSDDFKRTAEYRGVPFARVGMAVKVGEDDGVIVGNNGSANFDVLFTSGRYRGQVLNCHPHSRMRYFGADGTEIRITEEKEQRVR